MSLNNGEFCLTYCNAACCGNVSDVDLGFRVSDGAITQKQIGLFEEKCNLTSTPYLLLKDSLERTTGIIISGPCPFLMGKKCSIYNSPERPNVCNRLMPGARLCNGVRQLTNQPTVYSVLFSGDI
jgi:Fe-S-cluster containining protein